MACTGNGVAEGTDRVAIPNLGVQDREEALHLLGVPVDGVGDLARGVLEEVAELPEVGADTAVLEEEPVVALQAICRVRGVKRGGVLLGEVSHDVARLEHIDGLASKGRGAGRGEPVCK